MDINSRKKDLIEKIYELTEFGAVTWRRLHSFSLDNPDNLFLEEWRLSKLRGSMNIEQAYLDEKMSFCAGFDDGLIVLAAYLRDGRERTYAIELQSSADSRVFEIIHNGELQVELLVLASKIEECIGNPERLLESILNRDVS